NVAIAPNVQGTDPNFGWARRQGNNGHIYNTTGGSASLGGVSSKSYIGNHPMTLGAAFSGSVNTIDRFMEGQIGEVILIKRTLSQDERQKMEGYLAHKWGMQDELPTGHPYRNTIPMVNDALNTT